MSSHRGHVFNSIFRHNLCTRGMKPQMRVLHAALLPTFAPGVQQQMLWEQRAAESEGLRWTVRVFTPYPADHCGELAVNTGLEPRRWGQGSMATPTSWLSYRRAFHSWLLSEAQAFDVVMLRHSPFDALRPSLIEDIPVPVATVHHTLEVPELRLIGGAAGFARARMEQYFGSRTLSRAAAIIGVTPEICRYEESRASERTPTIVYPNGVFVGDRPEELLDTRGDTPELIFVASEFDPWHGLDRLIRALGSSSEPMRVHLVGRVPESLRRTILRDSRVELHGALGPTEVSQLLGRAWVGLSSFALERKGMTQACSLKVREYLRAGVPVYAGHVDVFAEDSAFYEVGKPDLADILRYAWKVRSMSRKDIALAARPYIDKQVLVARCSTALAQAFG